MAMTLNAGNVKRKDLFAVDPFRIEVKEELRGRKFPPTPEQVIEKAMSIYDHGQRQAIQCRKVEDNRLQSVLGFTRVNAIRLIREGFTGTDGVFRKNPDFVVKVEIIVCDDMQALINNIIENEHRNPVSDIDSAFNQQRLRDMGKNDVEIAAIYNYKSSVKVGRLRRLLELTEEEQLFVHNGLLPTNAAIEMLDLPAEERAKIVAELKEKGKISGSVITDQVRDHILRDKEDTNESESDNSESGGYRPRTIRNLRKFFENCKSGEDTDDAVARFCGDFLKYMGGRTTDKSMDNALQRLLEAKPSKKLKAA